MNVRDEAYVDWKCGMKYKDIAEKYKVSVNTVKSWASRYWNNDNSVATTATEKKRLQPNIEKLQPQKNTSASVVKAMTDAIDENNELTEQQKEFCIRFMQNRNATQAYLKVYGCTYRTAMVSASRLLSKDKIQRELRKLREIKNAALGGLCGDDIVELHMRIAFADITDYLSFQNQEFPVLNKWGDIVSRVDPETQTETPLTYSKNEVAIRDSNNVDGTLVAEVSEGRDGLKIKLVDKTKSLQFLERYFELNPNDRHRKEYDNAKLDMERQKLNEDGSGSDVVDDWISGITDDEDVGDE